MSDQGEHVTTGIAGAQDHAPSRGMVCHVCRSGMDSPYAMRGMPGVGVVGVCSRVCADRMAGIEVRRNEDGALDEIVATGATVHLEQMADTNWWMSIKAGGREVHVNFWTPRAVIRGRCEDV